MRFACSLAWSVLHGHSEQLQDLVLLGFERPTQGQVFLDGYDINLHSRRSLRSHIGYVPQDPSLLHLSVAENIALGAGMSSAAEIEKAARRANAYDFIQALPEGMETVVGERRVHLSGGQRQRIALAMTASGPGCSKHHASSNRGRANRGSFMFFRTSRMEQ